MNRPTSEEVKKVLEKYERKLGEQISSSEITSSEISTYSRQYETFRKEALSNTVSSYEKLCNFCERYIQVKPKEADKEKLEEAIEVSHLNITAVGAGSFATITSILIVLFAIILVVIGLAPLLSGGDMNGSLMFLGLVFLLTGVLLIKPLSRYPLRLAAKWRLEASNQMVLCILYIVMYMRHTSNLEHGIKFASDHIGSPLALDLRKVFWNVESGKFGNIKESLDYYLETWREWNLEFVEAFHLIEGSLYEGSENRRVELLEKSLDVMLEGTYEKMLHYAHDLKSPITMLHMLGIILPILGLVVFPLLGSFMQGLIKWYHLMFLYNLVLPFVVYSIGTNILSKRPTGYGGRNILQESPEFAKYRYLNFGKSIMDPKFPAFLIGFVLVLIGLMPVILHLTNPGVDFRIGSFSFLDYREIGGVYYGPYGTGAMLLSLFIPLGIALGLAFYYKVRTNRLMVIRDNTKKLEKEFAGTLFQLGNRIGDGLPTEIAFGKVAQTMEGTPTGEFFKIVSDNISKLGMGVEDAIFDEKRGAMYEYPSNLIESSMKVLLESAKKGPQVVAKSLISVSQYVARIHQVNERLKDLLADIVSSMKSQITFLTPMIAGIVVGIGTMVVTIIGGLSESMAGFGSGEGVDTMGLGGMASLGVFELKDVIPSYFFQIVVGVYVVELIYILSVLANGVENGNDKLSEQNSIGKNMIIGTVLYILITVVVSIVFNLLAQGVMSISGGGF